MGNLKRRPDILERKVGEEHMLYDASGRKVHVLNKTAYFIWQLCEGNATIDKMVNKASENFTSSPEELRTDIEAILQEFKALSLLE